MTKEAYEMNTNRNETVADIVAEMRMRKDCKDWTKRCSVVSDLADRIEKAHSRESKGLKEERDLAVIESIDLSSRLKIKDQEIEHLRPALRNAASVLDGIAPHFKNDDPDIPVDVRESINIWIQGRGLMPKELGKWE